MIHLSTVIVEASKVRSAFPSDSNIKQYRSGLASAVFAVNVSRDTDTETFRQMY